MRSHLGVDIPIRYFARYAVGFCNREDAKPKFLSTLCDTSGSAWVAGTANELIRLTETHSMHAGPGEGVLKRRLRWLRWRNGWLALGSQHWCRTPRPQSPLQRPM